MPFFDFHCHPGLKPTFADQTAAPSPWQFISAKLKVFDNIHISINPLFNEVLDSQSTLGQLFSGNVKLFGVALHAPEANMAKGLLEKQLVNTGAIMLLDAARLELIKDGNHYFEFTNADLNRLVQSPAPAEFNNAKFKILNKPGDFDETDVTTIYGFIIVEGLHCFFSDQSASNAQQTWSDNFESFTDNHTVIAINICHLQQNAFCNHAFGIQFINPQYFFPIGNGITDWGKTVIQRMVEKKILVDIKHMSLRSRFELYSMFRDPADFNKFSVPIICTHAGLTGQAMGDRVKYLLSSPQDVGPVYEVCYLKPESRYIKEVFYNCSSINLYNEDIEAILLSDGLIGLSFDQRILGFADENVMRNVTTPNDVEYISKQEAQFFLGPNPESLPPFNGDEPVWTSDDFDGLDPVLDVVLHPLFFLNQVIHILKVAQNNPAIGVQKATKKICLGSDFDGLINAIDNCKQVDKLQDFKQLALDKMPGLILGTGLEPWIGNIQELIENIFYNNGKNFIMNRLRMIEAAKN